MTDSTADTLAQRGQRVLISNYRRFPVAFSHGEGSRLFATDGRDYIDFCAGIAVNSLGHAHPALVRALREQAGRLLHVSNLYEIPEQIAIAEALAERTGFDRFLFVNSGAEANEAMIKFARSWGAPQGRYRIVVAHGGFHGRTLGALSATAQPALHDGFAPMLEGFDAVPFGDADAAAAAIGPETAAILVEPLQAEGGAVMPPDDYLPRLREICDEHGILLLIDEVQTGIGRCGEMLGQQCWNVQADAISLAKGLGGGVPIGALGVRERYGDVLGPGSHGSTFGGNPLACIAAQTVIATVDDALLARIRDLGERLRARLDALTGPALSNVRGRGLFVAFDTPDAGALVQAALAEGLLVVGAKQNAVRILPPLVLTDDECEEGLRRLERAVARLVTT
ncbi:MAG: aminotransferase class III-fold pyridoxal phosphate-dependent enzyme [Candidatus Dadabacteria bacterium]|nr:MAG: aminotransferase class III-fold pyridoxal phosphate-dependent enzyme [Candidatus Dadabacteria bacterium]